MAYLKTKSPSIKCPQAVVEAIAYITKKEKTRPELITYLGCSRSKPEILAREFELTRKIYEKNDNILSHHLILSYPPRDTISYEKAHQLAQELAEKCLSQYQVVIATHIDGKNVHTHFLINSVSPLDGKKFYSNKRTINMLRRASDEICYKNNLEVLEVKTSKYKRLDDATYRLALQGKSWKFNLVNDLDKALQECKNKDEFINFFKSKDYEIKYTDTTITFKKIGEKKSIRADTLSKQFGKKYSKYNIDQVLGQPTEEKNKYDVGKSKNTNSLPNIDYFKEQAKKEWKRYEKKYSKTIKIKNSKYFNKVLFSKNPFQFTLNLIIYIFSIATHKSIHRNVLNKKIVYRVKQFTDYEKLKKTISNVPYKLLTNTVGNTAQIKLYAWQISHLLNNEILCHSKIDLKTGIAIVTLKEHDLERVAQILGIEDVNSIIQQSDTIKNRKVYYKLKSENKSLEYLIVDSSQIKELEIRCVEFAKFKKEDDKYNIAFSEKEKNKILNILYPNKTMQPNNPTFMQRNAVINKRLKQISEETGEKLCYRIIVSSQYQALRDSDIDYAVFRQKDGKYNVVFLEHNRESINKAINVSKKEVDNSLNSYTSVKPHTKKSI